MKSVIVLVVLALALAGCKKEKAPVVEPVQKAVSSVKATPAGATVITGPLIIRPAAPVKK